jgi:hypothetical protein
MSLFHAGQDSIQSLHEHREGAAALVAGSVEQRHAGRGLQHSHKDACLQTMPGNVGDLRDRVAVGQLDHIGEATSGGWN